MERICCIFHAVDCDGWLSAWLVKQILPNAEFYGYDHNYTEEQVNHIVEECKTAATVFMVDVTLPDSAMTALAEKTVWIDHHKSGIERDASWKQHLKANASAIGHGEYDKIGACYLVMGYLVHNYTVFFTESVVRAVNALARYDVWDFESDSDIQKLSTYIYSHPVRRDGKVFEEKWFTDIIATWEGYSNAVIEGGKILEARKILFAQEASASAVFFRIFDTDGVIALRPKVNSTFFDSICKDKPKVVRVLARYQWDNMVFAISFFGEGAYELMNEFVTYVPSQNHGGHAQACGMTLTIEQFSAFAALIQSNIVPSN